MAKLGGVTEEGTVVSNLPLLFADGLPTSLEKITEKQLEKFIILMLNCSASREYFCLDKMATPKWWPNDVPFSIPLVKPPHAVDWLWKLKSLVTRCYSYHACDFMLTFCHDLAKYPVEVLKFVDLCDGTTSLLNKENGKLLVTFRNQNVIYDRKVESSPRKSLLPRGSKSSGGSKLMVQPPPPFIDIYLCDSCDAEFETLKEVRDHERLCRQEQDQQSRSLRSTTPDDLQCLTKDQSKFLNYLGLSGLDADSEPSTSSASPPRTKAYKRKCQGNLSFIRCYAVPISSPLGISLQKKMSRATYIVPQGHIDRVERYCLPLRTPRVSWAHLYKNSSKKRSSEWFHTYSFSTRQRLSRYEALKKGLSERSLQLLKSCPYLQVSLTRLSEQEIEKLTRKSTNNTSKLKHQQYSADPVSHDQAEIPVIDLCSSDEEDSGINVSISSPNLKSAQISDIDSFSKIEDCCSSQPNFFQNVTSRNSLPIIYTNNNFNVCSLSKPITIRKRSRRGRRSLESENETIPPTREQKKYIRNSYPHEGKNKLQELNQITESSDAKSKEWFPPFLTTTQTNHNGKKFSSAV